MDATNASPSRRAFLSSSAGVAAGAGLASGSLLGACASTREADEVAAADEALAHLVDARGDVEPISGEERAARRERLGALLAAADLDALLVEPGATMSHLSGISWGRSERLFGLVVLADGAHFWVTPGFEEDRTRLLVDAAGGPGGEVLTWQEHEYAYAPLAAELARRRASRVAVDPSIRFFHASRLGEAMGGALPTSGHALVVELRGRKDAHELALLRRANELTQLAILEVSWLLRPGMTGRDLSLLLRRAHERLGLTGHWDLSLIGPSAAYPHGEDTPRPLERGEVVLVDTGGSYHGYQSDNTRSWVFDAPPSERQRAVWGAVRDAQRAAFEALAPGHRAGDVDAAARRVLEAAGLTVSYSHFTHRLGHGIGMEGHEDPYLDAGSDTVLAPGMTFSDEPGIYLPGEFGVRCEDIVVVTEDGADHLGDWQQGPESPA